MNFKNLKIGTKLTIGFASVISVIAMIVAVNLVEVKDISYLSHNMLTLRVPTAAISTKMENGISHVLAALRGWMLLEEEHFKMDRVRIWKDEINPALAEMRKLSKNWTNPENLVRLRKIEHLLLDFEQFQNEIEAMSHTPDNVPSIKLLFTKAMPIDLIMIDQITKMINLEIADKTTEHKVLLGIMADVRGTLGLALSSIRAYLLSGDAKFKAEFKRIWAKNESRFKDLENNKNLLTKEQLIAFGILVEAHKKFLPLPHKMFELRESKDWNLANYWLSTKAAPIGKEISMTLQEMVKNQQHLLNIDGDDIKDDLDELMMLEWGLLIFGILLASLFGVFITRSITRPLAQAVAVANQVAEGNLEVSVPKGGDDETGQLLNALDRMAKKLLQSTNQLIMSEKMASLGGLVAGVAHEINTPVGVGVTAISHLRKKTTELDNAFKTGTMKKSSLEKFLETALESTDIILTNLQRAGELVKSFKKVAVDQTSGEKRKFGVEAYIQDILLSLRPKLKKVNHKVTVECPDDLMIESDPGALSQVVTNLIVNSLVHGLENMEKGEITLQFSDKGDSVLFCYHDNGKGMSEENAKKFFDPFFTTKRGQGGSGLGMHIVYNLVT